MAGVFCARSEKGVDGLIVVIVWEDGQLPFDLESIGRGETTIVVNNRDVIKVNRNRNLTSVISIEDK